jgi:sarcosine oxidase subunit alpha
MLADAARTYVERYGVLPGRRVVVCADHDSGYERRSSCTSCGGRGAGHRRPARGARRRAGTRAQALGIEVLAGAAPTDTRGRLRVSAGAVGDRWIACDLLLMAGGWTPSLHLHSQARGKVEWSEEAQSFLPGEISYPAESVGACRGTFDLDACLAEGWAAGGGGDRARPMAEPGRPSRSSPLVVSQQVGGSHSSTSRTM